MWGTQSGYLNNHYGNRSADAEPTADADAFFSRSLYQPQQQWGLSSYSNNWNQQYNPQQMWGAQSGYLNKYYGKRSADAEPTPDAEPAADAQPTADADALFSRSFYQSQQMWGLPSYSNNLGYWNQRNKPYNPQQMWGTQSGY